jgi:hypothetical protein
LQSEESKFLTFWLNVDDILKKITNGEVQVVSKNRMEFGDIIEFEVLYSTAMQRLEVEEHVKASLMREMEYWAQNGQKRNFKLGLVLF